MEERTAIVPPAVCRFAFFLPFVVACVSYGRTHFVGNERPRLTDAAGVELHRSANLPPGYTVVGVVTTTCETYDGASGLFERPCTEESLLEEAKGKAASVGGSLLVEPTCESDVMERSIERLKGGGAKGHLRLRLRCRATVVRPESGALPPPKTIATSEARVRGPGHGGEQVTIANIPVTLGYSAAPDAPRLGARSVEAVVEFATAPDGSVPVGPVSSECEAACSSAVARRGLKQAAANVGAYAVTSVNCEPLGERWRCEGQAFSDRR
jgi:hypothetical protein